MSNERDGGVSRRGVLRGAAVGLAATGVAPASAAYAGRAEPIDQAAIDQVASRLDGDLIELRREIHRHPELAGQEQHTAGLVAQRLRAAGLDVTTGVGGHGVVGVLTGARRGRAVAYRADMDAVPPQAQFEGGPDPAHICGHDIHTAVGVGVAQVLARLRGRLPGTVVFVFQPAEEALSGAAAMLDDGVFARVRPTEIHALHCGPFPVGDFVVMPGVGLAGLDTGVVTVAGADALARARALAADLGALGTVAPPLTPADRERLVADLQTPNGPLSTFVFLMAEAVGDDAAAEVRVAYKCWPEDRYVSVRRDIGRIAGSYDGTTVSFPSDPFPAMICPEREGRALKRYLRRVLGPERVGTLHAAVPFNGEDFALFLNRIPGTYTFLGVRAPGAPLDASYPHFGAFHPDERAIGHGVRAMAGWLATRSHR